uniref:Uncharacterized protein n=1 Tax=Arundo donax TaxID=35708 RepID=A0A0A9CFK7_ARUDO
METAAAPYGLVPPRPGRVSLSAPRAPSRRANNTSGYGTSVVASCWSFGRRSAPAALLF